MNKNVVRAAADLKLLLVGSEPLENSTAIFRGLAHRLGDDLSLVPDIRDRPPPRSDAFEEPNVKALGYAQRKMGSDATLRDKRNAEVPPGWKMQVSRPTPHAVVQHLVDLKPEAETQRYLGLIHFTDAGCRRRIASAVAVSKLGLKTQFGFGRRSSFSMPQILNLHCRLASAVQAAAEQS